MAHRTQAHKNENRAEHSMWLQRMMHGIFRIRAGLQEDTCSHRFSGISPAETVLFVFAAVPAGLTPPASLLFADVYITGQRDGFASAALFFYAEMLKTGTKTASYKQKTLSQLESFSLIYMGKTH
jgi:hypothetical protein